MNGSRKSAPNPWVLMSVNAEAPYGDHVVLVAVDQSRGVAHFAAILGGTGRCVAGRCRERGRVKALTRSRALEQFERIAGAAESVRANDSTDDIARLLDSLGPFWFRFGLRARSGAIAEDRIEWLVVRSARAATKLLKDCHLAK